MILKMPTNCAGNYYGGDTYELDNEDFDSINEADGGGGGGVGGIQFDNDFSEYLWMAEEEEFDKLEMQRLEEEALMEQCMEAMLDDELDEAGNDDDHDDQESLPLSWSAE